MLKQTFITQGNYKIGYACDLEGNLAYWEKDIANSKVLRKTTNDELELEENCIFIHGGDVCDRGNGDLRILKDLVGLKRKYPDRVHLILGNRDVNKLRLPVALASSVLAHRPHCYWAADNTIDAGFKLNDPVDKMQWLLKSTMGSPFSFETRRQEMSEILPKLDFTNTDIVNSYLELIKPSGYLLEYLRLGEMAVIIGDTIFVHGAITTLNNRVGFVPPVWNRDAGREESLLPNGNVDVLTWVQVINEFARREVEDYARNIDAYVNRINSISSWEELKPLLWDSMGGYNSPQPGSRLIQCGMGALPDKSANPGVIYASYLVNGKVNHLEESVANWLKAAKITKVVVGHQPNADAPLILDDHGVQTISNDSSYSKFVMWQQKDLIHLVEALYPDLVSKVDVKSAEWMSVDKFKTSVLGLPAGSTALPSEQADTRNEYHVNEVLLLPSTPSTPGNASSSLVIYGRLSLNIPYRSQFNEYIGKDVDGWVVKLQGLNIHGQSYYLLSQSEGFNFRNKLVAKKLIEKPIRK